MIIIYDGRAITSRAFNDDDYRAIDEYISNKVQQGPFMRCELEITWVGDPA